MGGAAQVNPALVAREDPYLGVSLFQNFENSADDRADDVLVGALLKFCTTV